MPKGNAWRKVKRGARKLSSKVEEVQIAGREYASAARKRKLAKLRIQSEMWKEKTAIAREQASIRKARASTRPAYKPSTDIFGQGAGIFAPTTLVPRGEVSKRTKRQVAPRRRVRKKAKRRATRVVTYY